jgi:hypothetical protein
MLPILEVQEKKDFHDLITGDECWFMLQYDHEAQWAMSRRKVSSKVQPNFQTPKSMFPIVWGVADFDVTNLTTSQRSFTSESFLMRLCNFWLPDSSRRGESGNQRLMVHLDNCLVHFSKCSQKFFEENSLLCVPQLHYLPYLAPPDF